MATADDTSSISTDWDEARLWALAETLSARMDAIRDQKRQVATTLPLPVPHRNSNVIPFRARR